MHEFALYGQVPSDEQPRLLQQLAGITRMQPQNTKEIHVVFKAQLLPGINNVPSAGGSQGVMQQEVQRLKNMLGASLYYLQLVGEVVEESTSGGNIMNGQHDVIMSNGEGLTNVTKKKIKWHLDFRDIPDAGKQTVSTRLIYKTPLEGEDLMKFMQHFGYDYVSRYIVTGAKFYDQDATIFLQKVWKLPQIPTDKANTDAIISFDDGVLEELDGSDGFTLQLFVEAVDGNNPELKDRAIRQLLLLKDTLKQAVSLTPGDRLALDSRLPAMVRRN